MLERAKLFMNGGSQAVRLPKSCRFEGDEVIVNQIGNTVILSPVDDNNNGWDSFFEGLEMFSDDFMPNGREQPTDQQERDWPW